MSVRRNHPIFVLLIFLGVFVFGVGIIYFGLDKLGERHAAEIITQIIQKETNGYYELRFENLDIDLIERKIELKKISFRLSADQNTDSLEAPNLYSIFLDGLVIELSSISDIYLEKQLKIRNIKVIDPELHVQEINKPKSPTFSFRTGNLYEDISSSLDVLSVRNFQVSNASLRHSPSEFELGNIDFLIKNFLVNQSSRPDSSFYSEGIEIEINDQQFELSDSIHAIRFDRFLLSTQDSVLIFENFVVSPVSDTIVAQNDTTDLVIYDLKVPRLELRGVDYFSAYLQNSLNVKEVLLQDAELAIDKETYSDVDKAIYTDNSLTSQLIKVFNEVKIGQLKLENTGLDLKADQDYNYSYQHIEVDRVDIVLNNLVLDSSNYQLELRKRYSDDLEVTIRDYSSYLADSTHILYFKRFRISSIDSTFQFEDVRIEPIEGSSKTSSFFNLELPAIKLSGIDFDAFVLRKQLLVNQLEIEKPDLFITQLKENGARKLLKADELILMIKEDFDRIGINNVSLINGSLQLEDFLSIQNLEISGTKFRIDGSIISWHDLLQNPRISAFDVDYSDMGLDFSGQRLTVHSQFRAFDFENGDIDYSKNGQSVTGDFKGMKLSGFSMDSIMMNNSFHFDTLELLQPDLTWQYEKFPNDRSSTKNYPHRYIKVMDGHVIIQDLNSVLFESKKVDLNMRIGMENSIHYANFHTIKLDVPESGYSISLEKLMLDYDQSVSLSNLVLNQDSLSTEKVRASFPAVFLNGFDQSQIWQDKKFKADSLYLVRPKIDLTWVVDSTADRGRNIIDIDLKHLTIDQGTAYLEVIDGIKMRQTKVERMSAKLGGVEFRRIDSGYATPLYVSSVDALLSDFKHTVQGSDSLSINGLNISSNEGRFEIDTLNYASSKKRQNFFFPVIKASGFDLEKFWRSDELTLDSLEFRSPSFFVELNEKKTAQPSVDLNFSNVNIGWLSLAESRFTFLDSKVKTQRTFSGVNVTLSEFSSAQKLVLDRPLDRIKGLSLSGGDLEFSIDENYTLNIGKYNLRYPENKLELSNLTLSPIYSPVEYSRRLEYQKDWFDISVSKFRFDGLNFRKWIDKDILEVEKASMHQVDARIYRDKGIPFPLTQVGALPQSLLRGVEIPIRLDSLKMDGAITYQEKSLSSNVPGEISFNQLDASLTNFNSIKGDSKASMILSAQGKFMNSADFKASVQFDMNHPKDQFTFTGEVKNFDLHVLNKILNPVANLNIKSGYSKQMSFSFMANQDFAQGNMKFRYDNLKVQLLSKDNKSTKGLGPGVKTLFANTFLIKRKNPRFVLVRDGNIFTERDTSRAIFNYWGKALFSGVISSIGINKSKKQEKRYFK
ncbi:MAG: hypothetical protein AAF620_16300 [Bacteroidota bacterium]